MQWFNKNRKGTYNLVCRVVSHREEIYPSLLVYEVGSPIPLLASSIVPVLLPGTRSLLGKQRASIQLSPL